MTGNLTRQSSSAHRPFLGKVSADKSNQDTENATGVTSQKEGSTSVSSQDELQLQITHCAFITEYASATLMKIKRRRRDAALQANHY